MALFFIKNNNITNTILTPTPVNFYYEVHQFNKTYNFYSILLDPILQLEINDKIHIEENHIHQKFESNYIDFDKINFIIHLDKYRFYQPLYRWYYSQSRQLILSKLDIVFDGYHQMLKKLKGFNNHALFIKIIYKFNELNNKLDLKLKLLKDTYNDKETDEKINQYISCLQY